MASVSSDVASSVAAAKPPRGGRWLQLIIGLVCMAMVANLQYGWTLFVDPMHKAHGWSLAAIQVAFSFFVLTETWLAPFEGWVVDRLGPRFMVLIGGLLAGLAWVLNAKAGSLPMLYLGNALGGIGAGAVYATCVGNALKWFPDHRGLAAGLTAAGFGGGSALTIIPISYMITSSGYAHTFLFFGVFQGAIVIIMALFLVRPPASSISKAARKLKSHSKRVAQTLRDYKPTEVLRQPVFWVMYVLFVMVAAGGLMATAEIAPIADNWHLGHIPVSMMGITLPAITFALAIDRVCNGVTRPFFGWVADHIGREETMLLCFVVEAIGIIALWEFGRTSPILFVLLTGTVFFAWGEIYSLFPSTSADTFGIKYATSNAGLLYTAKGTASLLIPLSNVLHSSTGSWSAVFYIAAALNAGAGIAAIAILRPMRMRLIRNAVPSEVPAAEIADDTVRA